MNTYIKQTLVLSISILVLSGCAVNHSMHKPATRNYFEYCRGKSSNVHSDIGFKYGTSDYILRGVHLEDESFYPDNSIIPNAFISHLFDFRFGDALDAFTEPYYGYRLLHFFKKNPHIGIGVEFIHHKIFALDKDQTVRIAGNFDGQAVDQEVRLGDFIDEFGVSHGINHVGLTFIYRWLLSPTAYIPDGRWQPFVSVSAGPTAPHLELNFHDQNPGRDAYSYQWGSRNWGAGLGLGVRFKPFRHFGFYLEYKLTYSHLHDMQLDYLDNTHVYMDFFAHHLQWGISIML